MNICIVAVGASALIETERIARAWQAGGRAEGLSLRTHYVGSDTLSEAEWPAVFASMYASDFVLLDTMGVPEAFDAALTEGLAGYRGRLAVVNATSLSVRAMTRLGHFSLSMMKRMGRGAEAPDAGRMMKMVDRLERLGRALPVGPLRDMRNFFWISRYWLAGGRGNLENMLHLIGREYFGRRDLPKPAVPVTIEDCSILDPATGRVFASITAFHKIHPPAPGRPGAGLLFRSRSYPLDTHPVMARVMERLSHHFNVVPVALDSTVGRDFAKLRALLAPGGRPAVDVLINPESFRLAQGPMGGDAAEGVRFLSDLGVPVLHPFFLTKRTGDQWREDHRGAGTGEFLISLFMPELDGAIEMYPIGAVATPAGETPQLGPIEDRIERLALRARAWSALRATADHDKRIALILYSYPPDAGSAGAGAFLDTFASVSALLARLAAAGYDTQALTADELREAFIGAGRVNSPGRYMPRPGDITVSARAYRELTADLPGRHLIDERWGPFPGSIMTDGSGVVLPGITVGKVFICLQPPRAGGADHASAYHDKHLPPHHQYAAFYRWLEREFKAHAIVHVGTHGTLEFLPGKEQALSADCFPDSLIGAMPHIYIYYSGNPAEAMIARRRSHGLVIGHLPPPFTRGGLYDDLQALQDLADEHAEARNLNPGRCPAILEDIRRRAQALGWPWEGLEGLHRRLHDLRTALIPARLHTLGSGFSDAETAQYLAELLRHDSAAGPSLHGLLAEGRGWDFSELAARPHEHAQTWQALEAGARQWIEAHIMQGEPLAGGTDAALLAERGEAIAKALQHNRELDSVMAALAGGYIPPGPAGDLFRCPDLLPTGRCLVQFDPRGVPSDSALQHGARIAGATLQKYRDEHGRYPRSTAVILWGLETSQTQGETIGQILAYLGARVVRQKGQWLPGVELVPLSELGRPRIDVTVQICGFFRDMFPNVLALLQQAFSLAGFADEPDDMNGVRAHARLLFSELRGQGMQEAEAREFSLARIFGPATSEYGTSLERIVRDRRWRTEGELVAAYIDSLKHAYTPGHYGVEMGGLLQGNLSRVEVVSQVRASRDYEITDLDHYYEFFGGLAKSVEQASGKKAMMLVSDTHDGAARTEDIKESISRGLYARLVNPAWLEGMLGHSHLGGHEIAKRMENLVGLAATTGAVDQAVFDRVTRSLVLDPAMRQRIEQNNPYALADIIQRLREAHERGYWAPDDDTIQELRQLYLESEARVEGLQP